MKECMYVIPLLYRLVVLLVETVGYLSSSATTDYLFPVTQADLTVMLSSCVIYIILMCVMVAYPINMLLVRKVCVCVCAI